MSLVNKHDLDNVVGYMEFLLIKVYYVCHKDWNKYRLSKLFPIVFKDYNRRKDIFL